MTNAWWSKHREHYNALVVLIGVLSFVAYAIAVERSRDPDVEITVFTLAFQTVGVSIYLGVANLAYSLGAFVERRIPAAQIDRYRRAAFTAGVALTVAPFVAVPVLMFLHG